MAPSIVASTSGLRPFRRSRPKPVGISTTTCVSPLLKRRSASSAGGDRRLHREIARALETLKQLVGFPAYCPDRTPPNCRFSMSNEMPKPKAGIRMIGPTKAKASRIGSRSSSTVSRRA